MLLCCKLIFDPNFVSNFATRTCPLTLEKEVTNTSDVKKQSQGKRGQMTMPNGTASMKHIHPLKGKWEQK